MKLQLILILYDELVCGKGVSRTEFCGEHKISQRTFYRYIKEINLFLGEYRRGYCVDITDFTGRYYLKKSPQNENNQ